MSDERTESEEMGCMSGSWGRDATTRYQGPEHRYEQRTPVQAECTC